MVKEATFCMLVRVLEKTNENQVIGVEIGDEGKVSQSKQEDKKPTHCPKKVNMGDTIYGV